MARIGHFWSDRATRMWPRFTRLHVYHLEKQQQELATAFSGPWSGPGRFSSSGEEIAQMQSSSSSRRHLARTFSSGCWKAQATHSEACLEKPAGMDWCSYKRLATLRNHTGNLSVKHTPHPQGFISLLTVRSQPNTPPQRLSRNGRQAVHDVPCQRWTCDDGHLISLCMWRSRG